MGGTRDRARVEMTANLNDEEWVNGLVVESYALVYDGSASVRMATRSVKREIASVLGHVGSEAKHPTWAAGRPEYASIQALLETDNAGGEVREQIMLYTKAVVCSHRVESGGTEAERDAWGQYLDTFTTLDKFDEDARFGKVREAVVSVCNTRGGGGGGGGGGCGCCCGGGGGRRRRAATAAGGGGGN